MRGLRLPFAAAAWLAPLLAAALLAGPAVLRTLAEADWAGQLDAPARARLQHWAAQSARIRRGAAPSPASPQPTAPAELSPREAEVLERVAAGDSNKLIARALELSPHTVKRHVANILDKIGVQTRGQAAAWLRARR